jgi:hypothetical protein
MSDRPSLRVLSYNVHRWGDDREALARVVKACAPVVALIQEAPTWWGTRRRREAMAASCGLRYARATPSSLPTALISPNRSTGGSGVRSFGAGSV